MPELMSTVFTIRGWLSSWNVSGPTRRSISASSGSRRNRAGERIRLNPTSACATAKTSLRHQRAHAGADDLRRHQPALGERLQHPDVGEAFHSAAAQHEGEPGFGVHVNAPLAQKVTLRVT